MSNIRKLETVVKSVLEQNKAARDDDFLLVAAVCKIINPSIIGETFTMVLTNHKEYRLPSFESITRARRKLQAEHEHLKSSARMQAIRANEEEDYIDYANE